MLPAAQGAAAGDGARAQAVPLRPPAATDTPEGNLPEGGLSGLALDVLGMAGAPARRVGFSDLAGSVVVLHVFATWCEPCREELPALGRFAVRMEGAGVRIFLIDVAEVDSRVRRFFETLAAPGLSPDAVLMDRDRAVSRALGIAVLPSTLVLGPGLTPRLSATGPVDWDAPGTAGAVRALLPGGAAAL